MQRPAHWSERVRPWHALVLLALSGLWYAPLLFGASPPFAFDDLPSIVEAPNVRVLWPLDEALGAPPGSGASGRPLVALTLALNHALGGLDPRGYHWFNVGAHVLAGLALWALARQVIELARVRERTALAPTYLALLVALPWAAHPLHTMAVYNAVYRNETLVALFYLLTLHCALRSFTRPRRGRWILASALCCVLGTASKEVIVSAPLAVFLFDLVLVSRSPSRALRDHGTLYAALLLTWVPLACFVAIGDRGEAVGFEQEGVTPYEYLLTQSTALIHYLRLFVWPAPLVLDYDGWPIARAIGAVWWQGIGVLALLAAALLALARRRVAGAIGTSAFLVLAPSSSVVPLTGALLGEHRMVLPCAALIALAGMAAARATRSTSPPRRALVFGALSLAATIAWGATTLARHGDYASELTIWQDTVEKRPDNPRAWSSLGSVLADLGRRDEAERAYRRALDLQPSYYKARINFGNLLLHSGRLAEAAEHYAAAVAERPDLAETHYYAGTTQAALGNAREGARHLQEALEIGLEPRLTTPCELELAWVLATAAEPSVRDGSRALELARTAAARAPGARALDVLAAALAEVGRFPEAVETLERALSQSPSTNPRGYAELLRARLEHYRAGRAWREPAR